MQLNQLEEDGEACEMPRVDSGDIDITSFSHTDDLVTVSSDFYDAVSTGDRVTYSKGSAANVAKGNLTNLGSYYVRKLSTDSKLYLYDTRNNATKGSDDTNNTGK